MKIIELQVDNIKGIRTARIRPTGDMVVISGKNGQGKTSLLDSIFLALAGGKASRLIDQPIRNGEANGTVKLDLGEFTVTKMWTQTGNALDVRTKDGIQVPSQQAFLDKLNGALWFDPLAFSRMKEKEQRKMLIDLIELPFDPEELEREKTETYDLRTDKNRDAKTLKTRLEALDHPGQDVPDAEISTAEVLKEYTAAQQVVAENEAHRRIYQETEDQRANLLVEINELKTLLRQAEERLADCENALTEYAAIVDEIQDPDLTVFENQLATAEDVNVKVRAKQAYLELLAETQAAELAAQDVDNKYKVLIETEREAIADAAMPIEGLAFTADGVTFNDIPFGDLSSAEQLKVSVAMGMALNPTLRVMRIEDGVLLDEDSIKVVEQMATDNDFQLWLETINERPDLGFVIRDGTVLEWPEEIPEPDTEDEGW